MKKKTEFNIQLEERERERDREKEIKGSRRNAACLKKEDQKRESCADMPLNIVSEFRRRCVET